MEANIEHRLDQFIAVYEWAAISFWGLASQIFHKWDVIQKFSLPLLTSSLLYSCQIGYVAMFCRIGSLGENPLFLNSGELIDQDAISLYNDLHHHRSCDAIDRAICRCAKGILVLPHFTSTLIRGLGGVENPTSLIESLLKNVKSTRRWHIIGSSLLTLFSLGITSYTLLQATNYANAIAGATLLSVWSVFITRVFILHLIKDDYHRSIRPLELLLQIVKDLPCNSSYSDKLIDALVEAKTQSSSPSDQTIYSMLTFIAKNNPASSSPNSGDPEVFIYVDEDFNTKLSAQLGLPPNLTHTTLEERWQSA